MCRRPGQLNPETPPTSSSKTARSIDDMNNPTDTVNSEISFSRLLELAAENDVQGFKQSVSCIAHAINEIGLWYIHKRTSKKMVLEHRTPLMVASTYGSIDFVKLVLSLSEPDVNRSCGSDRSTALHCAASSGSLNSVDIVKLLLLSGADRDSADLNGYRPFDVIAVPPKIPKLKYALKELLHISSSVDDIQVTPALERKKYQIDLSLPDITSGLYSTDDFRMFSFKILPCSRAYAHEWSECPFVHPGENARRRDPRKFHYSCMSCPDFKKGLCLRGDLCEYAHGVFESWLHPAQYRSRLCKEGANCSRKICFFAHKPEELRQVLNYVPSSPSAFPALSPHFTPPMSPSGNAMGNSSMNWPLPSNIPNLHLSGNSIQTSRLRSSFNGRDISAKDQHLLLDLEASSPRFSDQFSNSVVYSSSHKSVALNQLQQQQNKLFPISPNLYSPGMMSPRSMELQSPIGSRLSNLSTPQSQDLGMILPEDLGFSNMGSVGLPVDSMSNCESSIGKVDWSSNRDELVQVQRSFSMEKNDEEPDISWLQSMMKELMDEKS